MIYIDADACPVREEIYRVARRLVEPVTVVSNHLLRIPVEPLIARAIVGEGLDVADDWIAERAGVGDVVVTADIPLASRCVKAGARVISPLGKVFSVQSIGAVLATRDLMTHLRSAGAITGGPSPLTQRDRSNFLSALDSLLLAARRDRPKTGIET